MPYQQQPLRILLIDDDEDDFLITSEYIRQIPGTDCQIDWCSQYDQALEHLKNKDYDIYFTDYRLGAKTGLDLLADAREFNNEEPVIILTGKGNRDVDMQAMHLGAFDYQVKTELNAEKLERCIRYALGRSAALRALSASERKFRGIFEKTKDMVFVADEMLDFKDVNAAAIALTGFQADDLIRMNLCDLIEQAQHKKFLLHSLQHRREINDWEVTILSATGERRICILTASVEEDTSGQAYIQGIIHDITNLRREEKALLQAEKLAAAGRLVRTLAHEVRNPLNNITLSTEQLMQESEPDEQEQLYLNIILRNSRRISDLISELLNSSRPTETSLEPVHLQLIIDRIVADAIDRITLKHINLHISYPDTPITILADTEKLVLALQNIVVNAIEAMEPHTGLLSITIQMETDKAQLFIKDNGYGISEENIARVFEPYFTQKRNGVGLGLSFTLNILQAHKASIDVHSKEGRGTQFVVGFPVINEPEQDEPKPQLAVAESEK